VARCTRKSITNRAALAVSAVLLLMVSSRGQIGVNAHAFCWGYGAVSPINSGFTGQVGQESNLQPAVLESCQTCLGVSMGGAESR
jgi:hypothetical protein